MADEIIMSFDLSSRCIGVVTVKMSGDEILKMLSCPIIPENYDVGNLGFLKSKRKIKTSAGEEISSWVKHGEQIITKEEKRKRDSKVRAAKDIFILTDIGKKVDELISSIKPDLIIVEKNAIFNGILTSVLLGKVMGVLLGLAGRLSIPVKEYSVSTVRSSFNVPELTKSFVKTRPPEELKKIPDIGKRVLRDIMEKKYSKYGIVFQSDDESDACVVFDHWLTKERSV